MEEEGEALVGEAEGGECEDDEEGEDEEDVVEKEVEEGVEAQGGVADDEGDGGQIGLAGAGQLDDGDEGPDEEGGDDEAAVARAAADDLADLALEGCGELEGYVVDVVVSGLFRPWVLINSGLFYWDCWLFSAV